MRKKLILSWLLVVFFAIQAMPQQVTVVSILGTKMNKSVDNTVVLPANYNVQNEYPVVYLLHGHGGNNNDWINIVPQIKSWATQYQLIIVTPNGENSWYFDSPIDPQSQYESYIVSDLVPYIDSLYSTRNHRNYRAITGLSMGGHGALYLSMRNKTVFGSAGSMSGGLDITKSANQYDLEKVLGTYSENKTVWENSTALATANNLKNNELNLIIDCGTEDAFFSSNQEMHEKLTGNKVDHDFTSRPGNHNWDYWKNAVQYQLLYFNLIFNKMFNTWDESGQIWFRDSPTEDYYTSSWATATAPSSLPYILPKTQFVVNNTIKKSGENSLELTWESKTGGNWSACIAALNWENRNLFKSKEVQFWIYSPVALGKSLLPTVSLENAGYQKTGKLLLSNYLTDDLAAATWTKIIIPISDIVTLSPSFDFATTKSLFFHQNTDDGVKHTILIDEILLPDDPNYQPKANMIIFDNSEDNLFFDPSWINVTGGSTVEQPQGHASKFPVETTIKQEGSNSLKLAWNSVAGGNWVGIVASIGWKKFDLTEMKNLHFYVYSPIAIPKSDLPLVYMEGHVGGVTGKVKLGDYINGVEKDKWTEVIIPLEDIKSITSSGYTGWTQIKGVFFGQNQDSYTSHTLYLDAFEFNSNDKVTSISTPSYSPFEVYYANSLLTIKGEVSGTARVIDLSGKVCSNLKFTNQSDTSFPLHLDTGIYILQTNLGSKKFQVQ